jgi:hypothetical protein
MIDLVKNEQIGKVASFVYTIKFQKRGLPHAHIILILTRHSIPSTPRAIDCIVTAKIPNPLKEPALHAIVTNCMLHGPCTPSSPCWKDDRCSKGFPKPFCAETTLADDAYPNYKRRDNGQTFKKQNFNFHNGYVVPYNKYLLLR